MSAKPISVHHELIIPDTHVPYEDRRAYDIMLAVASDAAVNGITILGDYADFYAINGHGKSAEMMGDLLMDEVDAVNERLDELDDKFPGIPKVFIEGNHEWRFARYVNNRCPELFGLTTVESLFLLKQRDNWTFVPYGPSQLHQVAHSRLFARHEPLAGGTNHAKLSVEKAGCSLIYGHVHSIQEAQVVMANGDNHRGICPGWLGDEKSPIFGYVKSFHQWSLGFAVVTVLDDGTFFSRTIHIIRGPDGVYRCDANGMIYEG